MTQTLDQIFRHNLWANLGLINHCSGLEEKALDSMADGTYGTVKDTLFHILSAEAGYVARIKGESPDKWREGLEEFKDFDQLKKHATKTGEALIQVAKSETGESVIDLHFGNKDWDVPAAVIMLQMINHGNDHRSQILTSLTQAGAKVPDLDGWTYAFASEVMKVRE